MKYVGADLHKKSISFCVVVIDKRKTRVVQQKQMLCRDAAKIERFFESLGSLEVTVEATIGYDWFAALAEEYADRGVIAHSGKPRIIAESTRKTDKIDAHVLADILAHDMIPKAWRVGLRADAVVKDVHGLSAQEVLFSNPAGSSRRNMTIRLSLDGARSWQHSGLLDEGPSGYSDLAAMKDGTLLCLYERGDKRYNEKIVIACFNRAWLSR